NPVANRRRPAMPLLKRLSAIIGTVLIGVWAIATLGVENSSVDPIAARTALAPVAPTLPREVEAALQEKRFDTAAEMLGKLEGDDRAKADDRAYYALVKGTAERLGNRHDRARETLQAAVARVPTGPWVVKLRSALAEVELG